MSQAITILFLACTGNEYLLRLDLEVRNITRAIQEGPGRDRFNLVSEWAVRLSDLPKFIEHYKPQIVHFSGQGYEEGLVFNDDDDNPQPVEPAVLRDILNRFEFVRLVVLNACYTASTARELSNTTDYAVGISGLFTDLAASAFSTAFYHSLASGGGVQQSFERALARLTVEFPEESPAPCLLIRPGSDPNSTLQMGAGGEVDVSRGATAAAHSNRDESPSSRYGVFISYSHHDRRWLDRLRVHLRPLEREGDLSIWDDTKLRAGTRWRTEIQNAIDTAKVAILLVSADFLASEFIVTNELPPLLRAAKQDGARIVPVVVSSCRFRRIPALSEFQAVNDPERPLDSMPAARRERILTLVVDAVEAALES